MVPCLSSPGNAPHPRLGHAVAVGLSRPATYEGRSTQCGRSVLWRMVEEGPKEGGAGMRWETIRKDTPPRTAPNLGDYDEECAGFSWWEARARLEGLPGGRGLNIAHEAVDRHAASPRASAVALRCVGRDDSVTCVTYADLSRSTARFANVLRTLGIGHGDRVVTLLGRCPELYTVVLGTLKNTSVLCPLFSAFEPDPVAQRVTLSDAKVLVTTAELYRRKVAGRRGGLAALRHVLIVGEGADELPGTVSLAALMADAADTFTIPPTSPNDMALLHFTSGTTGTPKGAVHMHEAAVAHYTSALYALDLHRNDVFWCTADPGWVTGLSYGIVAPLMHGATVVVDEGDYDARRWYRILAEQRVSVWYTAPTALRMLMRTTPRTGPYVPRRGPHHQRRRARTHRAAPAAKRPPGPAPGELLVRTPPRR